MPFTAPTASIMRPSHILSIQGGPGTGKTFTAMRGCPGRISIQSTDGRWRQVVDKEAKTRGIAPEDLFLCADYYTHVDLSADELFRDGDRETAAKAANSQANRVTNELWNPFSKDYRGIVADPAFRTHIWDQADEFNEYLRLANFGKLEKNPQIASGPVNAEYKGLVREAKKHNKNLIMIHQLKNKYRQVMGDNGKEKSEAITDTSGNNVTERRMNKSVEYLIDSFIQTYYSDSEKMFYIKILHAKLNPTVNGTMIPSPADCPLDWVSLMAWLAPDVAPEAWEV